MIDLSKSPEEFVVDIRNDGTVETELAPVLKSIASHERILLMVYVHGWKHVVEDEHKPSSDRTMFQQGLRRAQVSLLARAKDTGDVLTPVGVYFRWRARQAPGAFENFFYWRSRNRANRIATGEIGPTLEVLLSAVARRNAQSETCLIGHSMGARILGRALERKPHLLAHTHLVVLLNAADHAQAARALEEAARQTLTARVAPPATPKIVWLTSRIDWATGVVFPLAEWKLAIGHSRVDRTHSIERASSASSTRRLAFTFKAEHWVIEPKRGASEGLCWNVLVPARLIAGHSDPVERFRQIVQSIYHLIYDRPSLPCYFDILQAGPRDAREIARHQIAYQYEDHQEKAELARYYLSTSSTRDERADYQWILDRLPPVFARTG